MKTYALSRLQTRNLILEQYQQLLYEAEVLEKSKKIFNKILAGTNVVLDSSAAKVMAKALQLGGVDISGFTDLTKVHEKLSKVIVIAKDKNIKKIDKIGQVLKAAGIKITPEKFFIKLAFAAIPGSGIGLVGANLIKKLIEFGSEELADAIKKKISAIHFNTLKSITDKDQKNMPSIDALIKKQKPTTSGWEDNDADISSMIASSRGVNTPNNDRSLDARQRNQRSRQV